MIRKTIAALLWLPSYNLVAQTTDEAVYQQAIEQARAGQTEIASQQLRTLATEYPDRKRYIYDYIQVLLWAERNDEVLREAENLDLQTAPAYVLEAVAKAARNKGQWDKATNLYSQASQKAPDRLTPKLGIGYILLDQKQNQAAIDYFEKLYQQLPSDPELTLTLAKVFKQTEQIERACTFFQRTLEKQSDNRIAILGLIDSQAKLENFSGAIATANLYRQALGDEQWAEITWELATSLIRQGKKNLNANPEDFAYTDQSIQIITNNLKALPTLKTNNLPALGTRAEADLLVALHDRKQTAEVINRFQRLQQKNLAIPLYAKSVAAQSYLDKNQYQNARDIYEEIIKEQPENFDTLKSLAKIALATNDKAQIQKILLQLGKLADKHLENPNYRYDYLQLLQWSGRNDAALLEAKKIDINIAPNYILETIAKAAREQHDFELAEKLYRKANQKSPQDLDPRLGLGLLMLDQHQAKSAARYFDDLAASTNHDNDLILAQAQAHEMAGHPKQASQLYQEVLRSNAKNSDAAKGLIRNLMVSGMPLQALQVAKRYRTLVSDEQWADLNWNYAAELIRRGEKALQIDPNDFQKIDQAIAAIDANLRNLPKLNIRDKSNWETRAEADLLVALRDRKRYSDIHTHYQTAQHQSLSLPFYALQAVADSYFIEKQPELARDVFLDSLNNEPDNLAALSGLIRAYLETGEKHDIEPVLVKITTLAEQNPQDPKYSYDLMQVLSWLGHDEEVLQQAQSIDMSLAPVYILEIAGRSARNKQDYMRADNFYSLATDKAPNRLAPKLALAGLMLDQQHNAEALAYLQQLRSTNPTSIELILIQAEAHALIGQPLKAAEFYREVLTIQPTHPDAHRGLAFALANADDTNQALQIANENRVLFNDDEWAGIKWKQAASLIRQGERALYQDVRDYRTIDQAIIELHNNIALTEKLNLSNPALWRQRTQFDLLVALRDRRRMRDTISLYEQLDQQHIEIPVYARMAAADAYLNNRQPEQARDLYLGVTREVPDYFNAKASLAYAYLEAEQPGLALKTAAQLAREQPAIINSRQADVSESRIANPKKAAADMTAAIFHAYVDDLQGAQSRLEKLHFEYPDNIDIHSKLAEVYYFRGWPRRAQREIAVARRQAPEHFGLQLNQAKVAHELRHYQQEASLTYQVYTDYPEDSGAKKQMQTWRRHNRPELKIFANGGVSTNQTNNTDPNPLLGNNNTAIDAYMYSSQLTKNFRIFAHEGWRTGLFKASEGGRGYLQVHGGGVEFAKGEVLATAEIHYDKFRSDAVGVDLGLDYQLNDQWQLFTRLSSLDNNISLRALSAREETVKAKSAKLGATFRVNESRFFRASAGYTRFSNDNDRFVLDNTYFERWYSGPIYKFATYLNMAYSTNSRPNQGFYFNPKQDAIASITLDNDWLTYRNYETNFHQRLALTIGNYWQENFGSNPVGNIEYEHRWQLGPDIALSYGGARVYRYYDNALTESWQGYLTADIRF